MSRRKQEGQSEGIAYRSIGSPRNGPPLILMHGFMGSSESWRYVLEARQSAQWIIALELPGHHEGSPIAEDDDFSSLSARLQAAVRSLYPGPVDMAGYSLGGRLALALAAADPDAVRSLTLIGVRPGLSSARQRRARRALDRKRAEMLREEGISAFVDAWEAMPLFRTQIALPEAMRNEQRRIRLAHDPKALALCLEKLSPAEMPDFSPDRTGWSFPLLLLCGEADRDFLTPARAMVSYSAKARLVTLAGCGHNLLLESPESVAALLSEAVSGPADSQGERAMNSPTKTPCWTAVADVDFEDIRFETYGEIAKITINRPAVRNAFRPQTVHELIAAFDHARDDESIGVVILTGEGDLAFCSGGDQSVRGEGGYVGDDGVPRLNVLELQRRIRLLPKPVIAMVAGYAIGGGHVLHLVCDLTIAADNARFGQTGPKVGSFDGGYGSSYLARVVGQKKAREIWFLCRQYDAQQALEMGLVNHVVPLADLETETLQWCREILQHSPMALRLLKASLNADCDGQAGLQQLAGDATLLFYLSEEAKEGKRAFLEKRKPDFGRFKRYP